MLSDKSAVHVNIQKTNRTIYKHINIYDDNDEAAAEAPGPRRGPSASPATSGYDRAAAAWHVVYAYICIKKTKKKIYICIQGQRERKKYICIYFWSMAMSD